MNIDKKLDEIFDQIDDLFWKQKFNEVDSILEGLDPCLLDPVISIGYLTITAAGKSKLKKRKEFFDKTQSYFNQKFEPQKTRRLLSGL